MLQRSCIQITYALEPFTGRESSAFSQFCCIRGLEKMERRGCDGYSHSSKNGTYSIDMFEKPCQLSITVSLCCCCCHWCSREDYFAINKVYLLSGFLILHQSTWLDACPVKKLCYMPHKCRLMLERRFQA